MANPPDRSLREALDRFDHLLQSESAEADFQRLFAECPYILSRSLPLRLEPGDIRPLGRPGRSEPDFLIFPCARSNPMASYGVIELKRPDSRILVERRRGVLTLSSDAATAVGQAKFYAEQFGRDMNITRERLLILGNGQNLFVIMGMSAELATRVGNELYERQLSQLLPPDCQLLPYDVLLELFKATVPARLFVLTPELPPELPPDPGPELRDLIEDLGTAADRQRTLEIRAWARKKSIQLSERGRIPADVFAEGETNSKK